MADDIGISSVGTDIDAAEDDEELDNTEGVLAETFAAARAARPQQTKQKQQKSTKRNRTDADAVNVTTRKRAKRSTKTVATAAAAVPIVTDVTTKKRKANTDPILVTTTLTVSQPYTLESIMSSPLSASYSASASSTALSKKKAAAAAAIAAGTGHRKNRQQRPDGSGPVMPSAAVRRREMAYKTLTDHIKDQLDRFKGLQASLPGLEARLSDMKATLSKFVTREELRLRGLQVLNIKKLSQTIQDIRDRKEEIAFYPQAQKFIAADNTLVVSTASSSTGSIASTMLSVAVNPDISVQLIDDDELAARQQTLLPLECFVSDSPPAIVKLEDDTPTQTAATAPLNHSVSTSFASLSSLAFIAPHLIPVMPIANVKLAESSDVVGDIIALGNDIVMPLGTLSNNDVVKSESGKTPNNITGPSNATQLAIVGQARQALIEKFLATYVPHTLQPKYFNRDLCTRPGCGRDMALIPFEGKMLCLRCKTSVAYFDVALNLGFGEETQTTPIHEYDRPKHLSKFLQQWRKGAPQVPDRVLIDVIRHYDNYRDKDVHDVKPTPIRDVLGQLGYKQWRAYAERISNRLQDIPVAQLADSTIKKFTKMFDEIQPVFALVKEGRHNMLTVYYLLNKFSYLLGLDAIAQCFQLLKTDSVLRDQDLVWARM